MKATERRSFGLIVAVVVWMMTVLVGYYYIHKPVTPPQAVALIRALLDVTLALAMVGLAGAAGRRLMAAEVLSPLERLALQAALGLGVMGLLWLVVGLLGGYQRWVAWGLLLTGIGLLRRGIWGWWREFGTLKTLWQGTDSFGKSLAAGSGVLAAGQLLYALAPPVKWDALMYHLQLPRTYLESGSFEFLPSNPYWGHPQLTEMLYTWGMALRGVETATTLGWIIMGVLLLGILGSISRHANVTSAWLAVAALLAGYSFRGMMGWGYADGLAALYGLAAFVALLSWQERRETGWLLWAGVFAGLAMWAKLTAALLIPLLVPSIVFLDQHEVKNAIKSSLLVISIAVLVFSPWLLINVFATGNPIYPHVWPTSWTSAARVAYFAEEGAGPGLQLVWLPLVLTWFGVEAGRIEGVFNYYSDLGPLLLIFVVPGLLIGWRKAVIKVLAIWLVGGWVIMALGGLYSALLWQSRVYFVLLPAVALGAGFGWQALEGISASGIRLGRILSVFVLLIVGLNLWQDAVVMMQSQPASVILGVRSREDYLADNLGWYAVAMQGVKSLPVNSKTLFLWEPRGYYAPLEAQADVWIDRWYLDRISIGEPELILDAWQEHGFTHLLVYRSGAQFEKAQKEALAEDDWRALDELLSGLPALEEFGGAYELYSLSS